MPPTSVHALILRLYEHLTLQDKRDFGNVIKLVILKWGDHTGLFGEPNVSIKVLVKERDGKPDRN